MKKDKKQKRKQNKKHKAPRANYTTVCWHSGVIFYSNRSTSKYLPGGHRQLYHKYGPQINPMTFNVHGELINADERLGAFYRDQAPWVDGWCVHQPHEVLLYHYDYTGPLPHRDELMVVGSYVIRRVETLSNKYSVDFCVKPIFLLTVEERATMTFIKGEIMLFEPHSYVSPEVLAEHGVIETKTVEEQQREEVERRVPIERHYFQGLPLKNFQKKQPPPAPLTHLQALTDLIQSLSKQPFLGKPVKIKRTNKPNDN